MVETIIMAMVQVLNIGEERQRLKQHIGEERQRLKQALRQMYMQ